MPPTTAGAYIGAGSCSPDPILYRLRTNDLLHAMQASAGTGFDSQIGIKGRLKSQEAVSQANDQEAPVKRHA